MKCDYCRDSAEPHYQVHEERDGKRTGRFTVMCHTCHHSGVPKVYSRGELLEELRVPEAPSDEKSEPSRATGKKAAKLAGSDENSEASPAK